MTRYLLIFLLFSRLGFSDFFKNHDQLESLICANKVETIVEVGSWLGESTIFMAEQLPPNGKIYAVDSWIGFPRDIYQETRNLYEQFLGNIAQAGMRDRIIPIRMTSLGASRIFSQYESGVDMIYIDADHSYYAVYSDIKAWAPYLRNGGLLCGNLFSKQGETKTIKQAVLDYCKDNGKNATFNQFLWRIE